MPEATEHDEVPAKPPETRDAPPVDDGWGDDDARTGRSSAQMRLAQPDSRLDELRLEPETSHPSDADDGWGTDSADRPDPGKSLSDARQAVERSYDDEPGPAPDDKPPDPTASDQQGEHRTIRDAIGRSEANEARTLDAAKDYAEGLGIEYVDFRGFDQETANEINATLEALIDRYPDLGGLRSLSTIQTRNAELAGIGKCMEPVADDTIAETTPPSYGAYAGIFINEAWARDNDEATASLERQEQENGHPPGLDSVHGVVAHEFGHLVYTDIKLAGDGQSVLDVSAEIFSSGETAVRSNVSNYAAASERECFAEAFAEYQLAARPRDAALRIGRAVDTYYGRHL